MVIAGTAAAFLEATQKRDAIRMSCVLRCSGKAETRLCSGLRDKSGLKPREFASSMKWSKYDQVPGIEGGKPYCSSSYAWHLSAYFGGPGKKALVRFMYSA